MDFSFNTERDRELFWNRSFAVRELGEHRASELLRWVADADSADDFSIVQSLHAELLQHPEPETCVVTFKSGVTLVIRAANTAAATTETGELNWAKVTRLRIMAIDAHDR